MAAPAVLLIDDPPAVELLPLEELPPAVPVVADVPELEDPDREEDDELPREDTVLLAEEREENDEPPRPKSLRLPRSGGDIKEANLSAAVVPVRRMTLSILPGLTASVRRPVVALIFEASLRTPAYQNKPAAATATVNDPAIHFARPLPPACLRAGGGGGGSLPGELTG